MSIGIRISKEKVDVKNAKEKDLIFDSNLVSMKVWKEGSGTIKGTATTIETIKIPHELSFTPMFLAYAELDTNKVFSDGKAAAIYQIFYGYTDTTNLNLNISGSTPRKYYYYILGDTAFETISETPIQNEFGLNVAKKFRDVNSGILEDVNIATDKPPLKLYKQGEVNIDSQADDKTSVIEHDLPFVPAFMVLGKRSDENVWSLLPMSGLSSRTLFAYSTPNSLVITALPGIEGGIYNFKYLIFGNRARS